MKSPAFRTTLLSAAVFSTALALAPGRALAAEAAGDEDEAKPNASGMGKIKDMGTRQAAPLVAEASDEAAQALKRMKVPEGLKIDLWAAEPMLANPVAFNFDEKGRIFVAETYRYRSSVLDIRDYMWVLEDDLASRTIEDRTAMVRRRFGAEGEKELSIEGEVVRLVEDSDGDGKADKSYVYADGFNSALDGIASGVLARRGKVWFTNIPSVWQFTGDKKAETRTELSRGYGVRFNYTGHDLHGLVWGPDGKIYFSNGDRGATVKTKEGTTISVPDEGAVFRCNPDGTQLELFAHGLRNPQSLIFTENGDLLTGDNDCDNGDEERLVHVVWGGDSGWRIGYQFAPLEKAGAWNTERLWHQRHPGQPAYLLAPICNIEDGPSGVEYYPGTGLNPSYKGSIFVTHFKGAIARSGIYTYKVKEKGASYEVTDAKPFLTSALPTDVKFGPDGRLYTSDWADGWPKSKRGRIYAISDPSQAGDALIKETKALITGDWTKRSNEELAKLLGHADWRVRLEAQYELAERGAPAFATLANTATSTSANPLARRHAIWGIGQQAAKSAELLRPLRTLLKDADSEVRAQALKVLGEHRSQQDAPFFIAALVDPNNRVKFFGAQGLAHLKHKIAVPFLFEALKVNADQDNYLRHALVQALIAADDRAALKAAAKDASVSVRLGALLALRRLKSADVQLFLADNDSYIAKEAAIAINDEPITEAYPALAALLDKPVASEPVMLRAINAHFRLGQPANAAALAKYATVADAPAALRAEAIAQLALWAKPPQRDRIVGVFRPLKPATRDRAIATGALQPLLARLLDSASPAAVQTAALKALQTLEIAGATDALFTTLQNEQAPGATRADALNALDKIKDKRLPEAVKLASASSSSELRLAALPLAARLSPDAAAPVLANLIAKGTVDEQKAALRALGRLRHPTADQLLTEQLTRLAEGKVNGAVQLELLTAAGSRNNPAIKDLLAKREAALAADKDPLAPYRVALQGGNRQRGESLFRNHPVSCQRCHRAGGDGGDMGPNLADIGAKYPREYLLEAVIKPNATIAEGFDSVLLTLKDGSTVAGIVAHDTADTLTVRDGENKMVDVKKATIANRARGTSAMPEVYGMNEVMTKTQLRDIIEYLASLKSRPATLDADKPRALRGLPLAQAATGGHP